MVLVTVQINGILVMHDGIVMVLTRAVIMCVNVKGMSISMLIKWQGLGDDKNSRKKCTNKC
jgi:hypothetical protein